MHSTGVHGEGERTRFTLFSAHATEVTLCLFDDPASAVEARRIPLQRSAGNLWQVAVAGIRPGQLYGYRVNGPHEPQSGHRFNPSKLLVDPYALAITGEPTPHSSLLGFDPAVGLSYNAEDSAAAMPKSIVVDRAFDWGDDRPPRTPWPDTVLYECHVRGLTRRHPQIDEGLRGTYLGLVEPPVLEHLRSLGISAVELLPIHQIAGESRLIAQGRRNYWGYSTLGYFAPHAGYATGSRGEQVSEFKTMVRELHRAGIEVILDVVYNHTAEGDHRGPTLSLKGIDNRNEANGEDNRDGSDHNLSRNWGHEGPTGDPAIRAARARARRNLVATLALSPGTPMLLYGDELGRTQGGNNNAYCQDNEWTWVDWSPIAGGAQREEAEFLAFVRDLLDVRRRFEALRRDRSPEGEELIVLHPDGRELSPEQWRHDLAGAFALTLAAPEDPEALLVLVNGSDARVAFHLPASVSDRRCRELIHTAPAETAETAEAEDQGSIVVEPFSLRVLVVTATDTGPP